MGYNSTVWTKQGSVFVAELCNGYIIRSNALQYTGLEGTQEYDTYIRSQKEIAKIEKDDCKGYIKTLCKG